MDIVTHPLSPDTRIRATVTISGSIRTVEGAIVLRHPARLVTYRDRQGRKCERFEKTGDPATMYPDGSYLVDIGGGHIVRIHRDEMEVVQ